MNLIKYSFDNDNTKRPKDRPIIVDTDTGDDSDEDFNDKISTLFNDYLNFIFIINRS